MEVGFHGLTDATKIPKTKKMNVMDLPLEIKVMILEIAYWEKWEGPFENEYLSWWKAVETLGVTPRQMYGLDY